MKEPADILYRPRGRFRTLQPGAHSSSEVGGFGVFRDHVAFLRHPDARRIELRTTLRDPFEQTFVRRFEQRSRIDIFALVDLSASMASGQSPTKFATAVDLCSALAFSATRIGDRFGLMGCDNALRFIWPATSAPARAMAGVERFQMSQCRNTGAEGFIAAAERLGATRKLVFVISDFFWPTALIQRLFEQLARHDAAPLVLTDSTVDDLPRWGLIELADSEGGGQRLVALRPALRRRWVELENERRRTIERLAAGRVRRPIFLCNGFDPTDLSIRLTAA